MNRKKLILKLTSIGFLSVFALAGCKDSNEIETPNIPAVPLKYTYTLAAKDLLGVSGTVTFEETSVGSSDSKVTITLLGAPVGFHPAHIHNNAAIETGDIAYPLNDVDSVGKSTTILSISYASLLNYDGYVNVHLDEFTLGTIIAQGDIGGNEIINSNETYTLNQDSTSGIFGTARFDSRKNGTTLVTIDLTTGGVLPSGNYPAQINLGSVSTIGAPVKTKTLSPVDGDTRKSMTNVRALDNGTAITFSNWQVYDGFMSVQDAANVADIISIGNIGAN